MTQLEAALREGSVFVVREDGLGIVARTSAGPTVRARLLRPPDLPARGRRDDEAAEAEAKAPRGEEDGDHRCVSCSPSPLLVVGLLYLRRRREAGRERVHVHFDDGSTVTLADDAPDAQPLLAPARRAL